ncbi:hypothetical protein K501DRAFT_283050 [Backusella circina FSU 941]|nr:hypothetical protein K501DRAFT_283050 [Backusella circina FSU 941]
MEIKDSTLGMCCVNGNDWPISAWNLQVVTNTSEDTSSSETDDNEDIFINQMEELETQSPIIKNQPTKSPTSLSLTPLANKQPQQVVRESTTLPHVQKQPIKEMNIPSLQKQPIKDTSSPPPVLELKKQVLIKDKKAEKSRNKTLYETKVPDSDPTVMKDAHSQFVDFLQSKKPCTTVQQPTKENGHVTITKLDVPNHPVGAFLSYSTWKNCSIWDAKAVLENVGSRKRWDPSFDDAQFIHPVSDTASIWHTKIKGSWPLGAHDYVSFNGQYISDLRVDLCAVSCNGDSYQHKPLPKEKPGILRATVNVQGYRLEQINAETISIRQLILAQISNTWVPHYLCGRVFSEICSAIYQAKKYFESYGAPPNLEKLNYALLVGVKHDHNNKSWRCEYTRHDQTETSNEKTKICIRLDKRRWANSQKNNYSVVVDPPPSRIHAKEKACDPFGVWLTVEHDKAFIIPLRGKILVLIKPDTSIPSENSGQLTVNGSIINVKEEEQSLYSTDYPQQEIISRSSSNMDELKDDVDLKDIKSVLDTIKVSPKEQAAAAFSFLKRTDEQFGWTVLTDNTKTGIRICKKSGIKSSGNNNNKDQTSSLTLDVPEPFMVYKISKVIENYSVDEVLAVVTDTDQIRKSYDDTIDHIELLSDVEPGCKVIKQNVKAVFPFKSREMYTCTCLAQETSSLAMQPTKRTFYIESSLPDYPSTKESKKVRGCLFISGWILEPVDPYTTTTNHPIVSTHVTYVAALDLGPSVPTYLSNLVANNWFPKKMIAVEKYLNTKGAPPFLTQPSPPLVFSNNKLTSEEKDNFKLELIRTKYEQQKRIYKVTNRWRVSELFKKNGDSSESDDTVSSTTYINHNRRPSNPLSDPTYRRGSLPSTLLKRRINPTGDKQVLSLICLNLTIDTCTFPGGYDIICYLSDITEKKRDMTGKLNVLISQIPISNLVNNSDTKKACKHSIIVCAYLSSSESELDFEFELVPAKEEHTNKNTTQLTVSGVLGQEDQNKWKGKITVNGDAVNLEEEIQLDYSNERNEVDIDHEAPSRINTPANDSDNSADEEMISNGIQYIGGGVVATALGNVSTSVNNLGARIMFPFRSSSSGALVTTNQIKKDTLEEQTSDENDPENESAEKEEESTPRSLLQRKAQQLRDKMDSHQKEILLMYICCGLSVIVALLLLQFMLERYYTSFAATREIYGPEDAVAYRLINVPWFRGWKVQLIAIKNNNL